jgi:S-adenosylmethionine:tRNA ribosyltransferase-isomerase
MRLSDFDYELPDELIAQEAAPVRDAARLLRLDRTTGTRSHHRVADLDTLLQPGDVLVVNDTRVVPARLLGRREPSGGAVECLLLTRLDGERWDALVHPGQKLKVGSRAVFEGRGRRLQLEVLARHYHGRRTIRLSAEAGDVDAAIDAIGHVPLPPYIKRADDPADRERYQTVFAAARGSVAAPTAGLHFTPALLEQLQARGVERQSITLHVGYGTFEPVRTEEVETHRVAAERYAVPASTASAVNRARDEGRRIIAVGTTTTRTLEAVARAHGGRLAPVAGQTDLYIHGDFDFQIVDGLLTNFHLPRSSLLLLVCAFAGRETILAAYREAVARGYRFYSYGDAMLLL